MRDETREQVVQAAVTSSTLLASDASPERWDVLIAGAGPAGSALALCLARSGFRVLLVDKSQAAAGTTRKVGETLAAAAQIPLRRLGLWEEVLAQQPEPAYLLRSAWETPTPLDRDSMFDPLGPSYHIDRVRFDAALLGAARATGAELLLGNVTAARWRRDAARFMVEVDVVGGARQHEARWLVDATGRAASLSKRLGARRHQVDDLVGVARWFRKHEEFSATLVEAAAHGYWYSAPLPDSRLVAVWLTDASGLAGRARRTEVWQRCLAPTTLTRERLEGAIPDGPASVTAAFPALTEWDAESGWLPVGDAAAAFDPFTGDGLCFALHSALGAADALSLARDGRPEGFASYRRVVRSAWHDHVRRRSGYYSLVKRFGETPFWTRRRDIRDRDSPRPR